MLLSVDGTWVAPSGLMTSLREPTGDTHGSLMPSLRDVSEWHLSRCYAMLVGGNYQDVLELTGDTQNQLGTLMVG